MSEFILENVPDAGTEGFNQFLWKYEDMEIGGSNGEIPRKVILDKTIIQNQGIERTPSTRNACTCFGLSQTINECADYMATLGEEMRWYALNNNLPGVDIKTGRSMSGALGMAKNNLHYIQGYAGVTELNTLLGIMASGNAIYTGTRSMNGPETKKYGEFVGKKNVSQGHIVLLAGYDLDYVSKVTGEKGCVFRRDNYGEFAWNKGLLPVPFSQLPFLYSRITVLLDKKIVEGNKQKENQKMIDKCIKNGVTNGANLTQACTREQAGVMSGGIINIDKQDMSYEEKLDISISKKIWNGARGTDGVTREELAIMISRLLNITYEETITKGIRSGTNKLAVATREVAAIMFGRCITIMGY